MSEALLQTARRAHASGNLPEAARIYAEILRTNSKNFDALYALGTVTTVVSFIVIAIALILKPAFSSSD